MRRERSLEPEPNEIESGRVVGHPMVLVGPAVIATRQPLDPRVVAAKSRAPDDIPDIEHATAFDRWFPIARSGYPDGDAFDPRCRDVAAPWPLQRRAVLENLV